MGVVAAARRACVRRLLTSSTVGVVLVCAPCGRWQQHSTALRGRMRTKVRAPLPDPPLTTASAVAMSVSRVVVPPSRQAHLLFWTSYWRPATNSRPLAMSTRPSAMSPSSNLQQRSAPCRSALATHALQLQVGLGRVTSVSNIHRGCLEFQSSCSMSRCCSRRFSTRRSQRGSGFGSRWRSRRWR